MNIGITQDYVSQFHSAAASGDSSKLNAMLRGAGEQCGYIISTAFKFKDIIKFFVTTVRFFWKIPYFS